MLSYANPNLHEIKSHFVQIFYICFLRKLRSHVNREVVTTVQCTQCTHGQS